MELEEFCGDLRTVNVNFFDDELMHNILSNIPEEYEKIM